MTVGYTRDLLPPATSYCSRRSNPFIANTRVLISSIDNSVASR